MPGPSPGQQFQQMQKQMMDAQRHGMQMAWWKQRKDDEARQAQKQGKANGGPSRIPARGRVEVDDRFARVESEVARLNQQLTAREISDQAFQEQMQELMVEDDQGNWWMVGASSGSWYRFDGRNWVQSNPPGRWVEATDDSAGVWTRGPDAAPRRHRLLASVWFLVATAATFFVGFVAADFLERALRPSHDKTLPLLVACVVWLVGLVISWRASRRRWRGR